MQIAFSMFDGCTERSLWERLVTDNVTPCVLLTPAQPVTMVATAGMMAVGPGTNLLIYHIHRGPCREALTYIAFRNLHCSLEYYSAIKKNEIMPFAAPGMDLEIIILSEVRKRKTNTIYHHSYVESKI